MLLNLYYLYRKSPKRLRENLLAKCMKTQYQNHISLIKLAGFIANSVYGNRAT